MASTISAGITTTTALSYSADTSGVLQLQTNGGTTAVTIDTNQNVGVGVTSPTFASGTGVQINNPASSDTRLRLTNAGTGTGIYHGFDLLVTSAGQVSLVGWENQPMTFLTNIIERARIDSNGNFLIGYTSSNGAYKLQVNSQIFATSSAIATSDANYKENVIPLTNALDLVKGLNPVQFSWKQHSVHNFDTTTPTVGFIAQEVQATLSQMSFVDSVVKQSEVTLPDKTKEQFLGIAEGNMIAILTAALKELSAQVTTLQTQVTALKG
jgi:surface antigen